MPTVVCKDCGNMMSASTPKLLAEAVYDHAQRCIEDEEEEDPSPEVV